jgi:hypothetical protein
VSGLAVALKKLIENCNSHARGSITQKRTKLNIV